MSGGGGVHETGRRTAPPPLPYRSRPPQVLLGVGAVLLVTAAAALASGRGDAPARVLLLLLAGVAAALSLRATAGRLRSSAETLAGCAGVLGLAGATAAGPPLDGEPVTALVLATAFLGLHVVARLLVARPPVLWALASWAALQLAVLRVLDEVPPAGRTAAYLGVLLLGVGIALSARPLVARVALVTAGPWWAACVIEGSAQAWTGSSAGRWTAAALVVAAGAVLVPARGRSEIAALLGPRDLAPGVGGVVAGAAMSGALAPLGTPVLVAAGYAGVLLASVAAALLTGRWRRLLLPIALTAGVTIATLCVAQLIAAHAWGSLSLLLLLTAAPTVWVALRRPEDRPVAVPVAVWCLTGSALLAFAAGTVGRGGTAALLTAVYVGAMAIGSGLRPEVRRATARAAALTGAAAVVLPVAAGTRTTLVAVLVVQGLATLGWAWRTGRDDTGAAATADDGTVTTAWRIGAAHLVLAGWTAAALLELHAVEAWTLPLAGGLLLAAGRRLARGRSWPAYGPGLLVAAVPSTVLAVLDADGPRPIPVLAAAVLLLLTGSRTGVLAPLVVGAGTAVLLVLGLAAPALPWPLAAALTAGVALLAWGTLRERHPVAGFRFRLADLR